MHIDVNEHVMYKIANEPILTYPYPHFFIQSIFPESFYDSMLSNLPPTSKYTSIAETGRVTRGFYKERFIISLPDGTEALDTHQQDFWIELTSWLLGDDLLKLLVDKFRPFIAERFSGSQAKKTSLEPTALLIRDFQNYAITPHPDAPHRLLALMFYMPHDDSTPHVGTSIYRPIDSNLKFEVEGSTGGHYPRESFKEVKRMDYLPNSFYGFFRTDNSFHGVELVEEPVERNSLLYYIRVKETDS